MAFPIVKLSRKRSKDKVWLTRGLKKSIQRKGELYKKFLNSPTENNKEKYKRYRNKLTGMLRIAEGEYYKEKINEKKKSLKALWEIYGPVINPNKVKKPF